MTRFIAQHIAEAKNALLDLAALARTQRPLTPEQRDAEIKAALEKAGGAFGLITVEIERIGLIGCAAALS